MVFTVRDFYVEGFMSDILKELADYACERVEKAKQIISPEQMKMLAEKQTKRADCSFYEALSQKGMSFICECKQASPSKGIIAEDFPYTEIAKDYEESGAAAISVLTEPKWFLGSLDYLREIRDTVRLPLLRKDFTVDEYMIYEAREAGADAILLIVTLLEEERLKDYIRITRSLGMDALVETHDEEEIRTACRAGADIIGVNNRNLRNFTVDLNNSVRLRSLVPENILFVAESGIRSRENIETLERGNINAVLIGEQLMRSGNRKEMLRSLKGE